jgi:2-polyprenyl-3-methyl-5-hydroxy-6-metoxy-1,4-benzoquinol methylase
MDTRTSDYANYLTRSEQRQWKRALKYLDPYRWHIRRLVGDSTVLDIGCGAGRNLRYLVGRKVVGIDHNEFVIEQCRHEGFVSYTTTEFSNSTELRGQKFSVLLMSHLLEHLTFDGAVALVRSYLSNLSSNGRVIIICPQPKGQRRDATHLTFFHKAELQRLCEETNLSPTLIRSFPLPSLAGRWLYFNETVVVAEPMT